MKKLTTKLILIPIIVVSLTTTSCIKETGCTDPNGLNYSATAVIDDGSCTYEGSIVFWYGKSVAEDLVYSGVTSLTYYVNEEI